MSCFVCFLNFPGNKKWPKNKSSQNALKISYDFFPDYFWISSANNIRGRCTRWAQPTWARQHPQACPGGLWSPRGPPHLSLYTTSSPTSRKKNLHCSLSRVLAHKPADFDLFARSSVSKTVSGDCCLVCESIIFPISFYFSGLYFE